MSDAVFQKEFHVRWSDLDPNFHMRHTAYGDLCAATRFYYLASVGLTMEHFTKLKVGPILFSENIKYMSEVRANDKLIVNIRVSGLSEDGRKFKMHHEVIKASDNKLAATLEITGAWLDQNERKIIVPPEEIKSQMQKAPRTESFEIM